MQNPQQKPPVTEPSKTGQHRPNERSGLDIAEFVRISDPKTQETFLEKRG